MKFWSVRGYLLSILNSKFRTWSMWDLSYEVLVNWSFRREEKGSVKGCECLRIIEPGAGSPPGPGRYTNAHLLTTESSSHSPSPNPVASSQIHPSLAFHRSDRAWLSYSEVAATHSHGRTELHCLVHNLGFRLQRFWTPPNPLRIGIRSLQIPC